MACEAKAYKKVLQLNSNGKKFQHMTSLFSPLATIDQ